MAQLHCNRTCSNCKVTYYGKAFRNFYTKAAEHIRISNLTGKRLKNVKESAVSDNLLQCNCAINIENALVDQMI